MPITLDAVRQNEVQSVGENSADNIFSSALVASDRDGSVLERTEFLMDELDVQALAIASLENSVLVLTETGATLTTDGTEQNLYINDAPAGIYEPRILRIDFTAHTAAETVIVREYYRIKSGGNYIKADEVSFVGVQDPLLISVDLEENRYGVKTTMEKTAGANQAYDYEVVYKI